MKDVCREPIILHPTAAPVYRFLAFINSNRAAAETLAGRTILGCGAGGWIPPVALFAQRGMTTYGIDIGDEQLARARRFCRANGLSVAFRKADMRSLPYDNASFACVCGHFLLCPLCRESAAWALAEMKRVLKP